MRSIRVLSAVVFSTGAVACTTILGDFSDGNGGPATDAGPTTDSPSSSDGATGDGTTDAGPFAVTPMTAKMGILRSRAFTAAVPVTWSVPGGATNGTVDAMGNYHSPVAPGTYQLFAKSVADPTQVVDVSITVENLAISVAAGVVAGVGNADGPAKYAHLQGPQGVAYIGNSPASVIIADTGNQTLRKLDETSGNVTTLAGTVGMSGIVDGTGSAALFSGPTKVVANDTSFVWVVDSNGTCIRKVEVPTSQVTTYSGTCGSTLGTSQDGTGWSGGVAGTAQFAGIESMVLGPDGAIYTCEINNGFRGIRRVDITSGYTQTVISGLTGQCALGSDNSAGRLYFNDDNQSREVEYVSIPTSGYVGGVSAVTYTTMPGTESSALSMATLTGSGGFDDLFLLAGSGTSIDHAVLGSAFDTMPWSGSTTMTGYTDGANTAALYYEPQSLFAYSPQGKLFVADSSASDIRQIVATSGGSGVTGVVSTIVAAAHASAPADGAAGTGRLIAPTGIASDAAGNLYIADASLDGATADTIRKVDTTGKITTYSGLPGTSETTPVDGSATTAVFGIPFDMVMVGGILYVVDLLGEAIRAVDAHGAVTTFAGKLAMPGTVDGTGTEAQFAFFNLSGNSIGGGIATDGTNLYVADSGNHSIRQIAIATQKVTTIAGGTMGSTNGTGTAAQFVSPGSVAYDAGKLYISDAGDDTIRVMDLTTKVVTTLIGLSGVAGELNGDAAVATFNSPFRLIADGIGNIYVTDFSLLGSGSSAHTIRRIDLSGPSVTTFAGATGKIGTVAGALPSTVNTPFSFALTASGDLLFGDFGDQAVGLISAP